MFLRAASYGFIKPALPSTAERPPNGTGWIHEIEHDGYRLMVRQRWPGKAITLRHGAHVVEDSRRSRLAVLFSFPWSDKPSD